MGSVRIFSFPLRCHFIIHCLNPHGGFWGRGGGWREEDEGLEGVKKEMKHGGLLSLPMEGGGKREEGRWKMEEGEEEGRGRKKKGRGRKRKEEEGRMKKEEGGGGMGGWGWGD